MLRDLPKKLSDPLMVITYKDPNRYDVVFDTKDANGATIIAQLRFQIDDDTQVGVDEKGNPKYVTQTLHLEKRRNHRHRLGFHKKIKVTWRFVRLFGVLR